MSRNAQELNLLAAIKDVVYHFQDQKYIPHSIHKAKLRFYGLVQGKHVSTQAYHESFQNHINVIKHCSGLLGIDPGISKAVFKEKGLTLATSTTTQKDEVKKETKERYLTVAFILGADRGRYGKLIEVLENNFTQQGQTRYPKT